MRLRTITIIFALMLLVPFFASAKSPEIKGYAHSRGKAVSVEQPSGWPVSVSASHWNDVSVEALSEMAVIRSRPYTPWWRFWTDTPATTTLTVKGLPADTDLHAYTRGYREHTVMRTDERGSLSLDVGRAGTQFIIKTEPSTYEIQVGGLINPKGGDCNQIGLWTEATKTCKLNRNVAETIAIIDPDITLDGGDKTIQPMSGDGVYTDESNVTVRNVTVTGAARGIVFSDSLFTFASGGFVAEATTTNSSVGVKDEGVSGLSITGSFIAENTTGIFLFDQNDGFPTNNIVIAQNNFVGNGADLANDQTSFTLQTPTTRGNFWSKNTDCVQSTTNPNHCTNDYNAGPAIDTAPWACKNAWLPGVVCPTAPPPPPPPLSGGTCTAIPPAVGDYMEVKDGLNGGVELLETPDVTSRLMKRVPNGWVFQIADTSNADYLKIKDFGTLPMGNTMSTGYILRTNACTNASRKTEFEENTKLYDTNSGSEVTKRKELIVNAIETYATTTNTVGHLYGTEGGRRVVNKLETISGSSYFKPVMLAIFQQESGDTYNNRVCSGDTEGGIGIGQMTSDTYKGLGSNLADVLSGTYLYMFDDCQNLSGNLPLKGHYYTNTKQGIHAATKDSAKRLRDLYMSPGQLAEARLADNITKEDMRWASAAYSYNQGSPFKALFAYYAWESIGTATTSEGVLDYLIKLGYKNVKDASVSGLIGGTRTERITWIQEVKDECSGLADLRSCFKSLSTGNDAKFKAPALYLEGVGENLGGNSKQSDFGPTYQNPTLGDKFIKINTSSLITGLASPAVNQVTDPTGRRTGIYGGTEITEIPNTYNHKETESVTLFFPDANNKYKVVGTDVGTYDYVVIKPTTDNVLFFTASGIPIAPGAVHTYIFDWTKIAVGQNGVTITIDQDGDGLVDKSFIVDWQLTPEEFKTNISKGENNNDKKIIICHNASKTNPHAITVAQSAVKAHLAHGDTMGNCVTASPGNVGNSSASKKDKRK